MVTLHLLSHSFALLSLSVSCLSFIVAVCQLRSGQQLAWGQPDHVQDTGGCCQLWQCGGDHREAQHGGGHQLQLPSGVDTT